MGRYSGIRKRKGTDDAMQGNESAESSDGSAQHKLAQEEEQPNEEVQTASPSPLELLRQQDGYDGLCKHAWITGSALTLFVFAIYVRTLYPSLPGGDSGELIVASCKLGLAHPPGYPTFTMLGYLFTWLPFGTVAWRVNLMSALCGTGAAAMLFLATFRATMHAQMLTGKQLDSTALTAGILASGTYAFAPLVWFYSVQAEVFAMNNFFVAALLAGTVNLYESRSVAAACRGAFIIGLGLSNQHTLVFFAFPLVLWSLAAQPFLLRPVNFGCMALCGLVGLLPYAYLPIASINASAGAWGDQSTVQGFLKHLLRQEYGTFRLYSGNDNQGDQLGQALKLYTENFHEQTLGAGWPCFALGTLYLLYAGGRRFSLGLVFVVMYAFYMIVFHLLSNLPIDQPLYFGVHIRFWMQPHALAMIWLGVGASVFAHWLISSIVPLTSKGRALVGPSLAVLAVLARCYTAFEQCDQSDNWVLHDYGLGHLDPLPRNSILVVKGDIITNSIRYHQVCRGVRPDVRHLDQSMMTYEWYTPQQSKHLPGIKFPKGLYHPYKPNGYSMREFLLENALNEDEPTFLCGGWYHDEQEGGGIPGFILMPMGACDIILPQSEKIGFQRWAKLSKAVLPNATSYWPPAPGIFAIDTWEQVAMTDFWAMWHRRALHMLNEGIEKNNDQKILQSAVDAYEDILKACPEGGQLDYIIKNAGVAWGRLQRPESIDKMLYYFRKFVKSSAASPEEKREIKAVIKQYAKYSRNQK